MPFRNRIRPAANSKDRASYQMWSIGEGSSSKNFARRSKSVASKATVADGEFARYVLKALGIRAARTSFAPSARARRAVSSPMPALPPITTTFVRQVAVRAGWERAGCDAHDSSVQRPRIAFGSRNLPARRAGLIAGSHRYSFCPARGRLRGATLVPAVEARQVARVPCLAESRGAQVPVGADFARHRA